MNHARAIAVAVTALIVMTLCPMAMAVKIADITRLGGERTNELVGLGLVVGLKGTGDGGDYQPAMKPLVAMLKNLKDPVSAAELNGSMNVALVGIMAQIPANGAREGDHLNVHVACLGAAKSLRGGRLFVTPLQGPDPANPAIFALAEGAVVLEDPATPTVGTISGGAVMETDWQLDAIQDGKFLLVLDQAAASTWTPASTIAKIINDAESSAGETLATVKDRKTIEVTIPPNERERPDSFISRVQRLPVPILPTEAQVLINEQTGTMIVTGDVEISPVVISHQGLTITTITPTPVPTPMRPNVNTKTAIPMDTTNTGGAKLQDLVAALDQLKVPAQDRITIVKQLHATGKLHAKLVIEQ